MKRSAILRALVLILAVGLVAACAPVAAPTAPTPAEEAVPAKPWEGQTITVFVIAEGPEAGISGPFYHFRDEWEQMTGAKLEIAEFPFGELHEKMLTDILTGAGRYDIFVVGAWEYGDLIAANGIIPTDQFYGDPRFPEWPKDLAPNVANYNYIWGGQWYGVPNDADGQVLYYRKDILTDPQWQEAFKAEKGYDLPVPPTTWDELYDISAFFNGQDWNGDGEPDSGISMHLKVGGQGMFHFTSLSAPFVVLPGPKVDNVHNTYWFDFETMEPIINEPGHVRALEFLQKLAKTGPDAQLGWTLGEAWDYFLRGKAIFTFSWGDVGSLAQDPERSEIKGKLGVSILPGVYEVYDRGAKEFVKLDEPNVVGNTTGGTWHGVISSLSKNPELAYHLLSFHAAVDKARFYAYHGWEGVDIGRESQFIEPYGTNTLQGFLDAGWDENDIQEYNKAYYDTYYAETVLPYLRIRGSFEYLTALDQALSKAMTGELTAQQALDLVAGDFRKITERLGKEQQLQLYRDSFGYEK